MDDLAAPRPGRKIVFSRKCLFSSFAPERMFRRWPTLQALRAETMVDGLPRAFRLFPICASRSGHCADGCGSCSRRSCVWPLLLNHSIVGHPAASCRHSCRDGLGHTIRLQHNYFPTGGKSTRLMTNIICGNSTFLPPEI